MSALDFFPKICYNIIEGRKVMSKEICKDCKNELVEEPSIFGTHLVCKICNYFIPNGMDKVIAKDYSNGKYMGD